MAKRVTSNRDAISPEESCLTEDHPENLPAARLGDGIEDGLHDPRCSNHLRMESNRHRPALRFGRLLAAFDEL